MKFEEIAVRFPKQRPVLTEEYQAIHDNERIRNRKGEGGLARAVMSLETWMQRSVLGEGGKLLEIGAGTLNHVPFEKNLEAYDVIEPFKALYQSSPYLKMVNHIYAGIDEIPLEKKYNRIVSVAVLEHLEDLVRIMARVGLHLEEGGECLSAIPTEGGLLWGLGWRCTTGLSYRFRTGLDYSKMLRHEHINDASEIEEVLRFFFKRVEVKRFPTPLFHLSFYSCYRATEPIRERCERFAF